MSRKLDYLNAAIALSSTTAETRQCLLAHRGMYFGRKGEASKASADIKSIQAQSSTVNLRVTILKNLAEGIIDFYCSTGKNAIDKAMRAYSLASAGTLSEERALSAAWLAHFFDSDHNVERAADFASQALSSAGPEAHDARARAGLVVGQNLGIAGRADLASVWYARVLKHANANGDELNVSALMFNRTMERVSRWRQIALQSRTGEPVSSNSATLAESAANFDVLVGNHGLEHLNPLLKAQVLSLKGSHQEALDIYSVQLPREDFAIRMQADFLADQSLCLLHTGQREAARQIIELALQRLIPETHPDDRAATHSRAALVYEELGLGAESSRHSILADGLWKAYRELQKKMVELFSKIPVEKVAS